MILNSSFLNRNIPQIELKAGYKISLLSHMLDKKYPVIEFVKGENLNRTELGGFSRAGLD
jgi:hypothetical protein